MLEEYGIGSDTEAAETIAAFWEGEKPDNLLASIRRVGNREISQRAYHYALRATEEHSEDREAVTNAWNLLWRNYRGGHGG